METSFFNPPYVARDHKHADKNLIALVFDIRGSMTLTGSTTIDLALGTILVALFTAIACTGLLIFHRLLHIDLRKAHTTWQASPLQSSGSCMQFCSLSSPSYLESFEKASDRLNPNLIRRGIYLGYARLASSQRTRRSAMRGALLSAVIDEEWPVQRAGRVLTQGWNRYASWIADRNDPAANLGEAVIETSCSGWSNSTRHAKCSSLRCPGTSFECVWWIVFLGALITTCYTYFFGITTSGCIWR